MSDFDWMNREQLRIALAASEQRVRELDAMVSVEREDRSNMHRRAQKAEQRIRELEGALRALIGFGPPNGGKAAWESAVALQGATGGEDNE